MTSESSGGKATSDVKAMGQFTGIGPENNESDLANDAAAGWDEAVQSRFIEIRDVDVNTEVMDLQGELKVAMMEIARVREQLTQIGAEGIGRSLMSSDI